MQYTCSLTHSTSLGFCRYLLLFVTRRLDGSSLSMMGNDIGRPSLYALTPPQILTDFASYVKLSSAESSTCRFGVAFHLLDVDNYYALTINRDTLEVWHVQDGDRLILSSRPRWQDFFIGESDFEVLVYSNGNTTDDTNTCVEVEVFGRPVE